MSKQHVSEKYVSNFLGENSEIYKLGELTKDQNQLLIFCLDYIRATNVIDITKHRKEEIAKKIAYVYTAEELKGDSLKKKVAVLEKHISKLVKLEIFLKIKDGEISLESKTRGSGTYYVNPFIYGKGKWSVILELRDELNRKRKDIFSSYNIKDDEEDDFGLED